MLFMTPSKANQEEEIPLESAGQLPCADQEVLRGTLEELPTFLCLLYVELFTTATI